MSITKQQVLDYIDTHPLRFQDGDFSSFLDMLYDVYSRSNPVDTVEIRRAFDSMHRVFALLPPEESDQLFSLMGDMCLQCERAAFAHGLMAGLYLHTELSSLA